jgi:hypothetical protein
MHYLLMTIAHAGAAIALTIDGSPEMALIHAIGAVIYVPLAFIREYANSL